MRIRFTVAAWSLLTVTVWPNAASAQATCTASDTAVIAVNPGDAVALAGDCAALLNVMDTLRGTGALNWTNTLSIASWDGIALASNKNRVAGLTLRRKGLSGGTIPDLSALASLSSLTLHASELSGSIVAAHFPPNLQELDLAGNELTGSIPDLSKLTSLEELHLSTNELTGNIVAEHFPADIEELILFSNDLTGSIPDLSELANLESLNLTENRLSGSIPDLSKLAGLQTLVLSDNDLTGNIPDLSKLAGLRTLALDDNELTGSIPDLSKLTSLRTLRLSDNELTGNIPDLSKLTSLRTLWLHRNSLTGEIPDLSALANLQSLVLSDNELTGNIPDPSKLTSLRTLWLHRNSLTGEIPDLSALANLRYLDLAWNRLTGGVSPQLDDLTALRELSLCGNDLAASATLPTALETRRTGNLLTVYSCLRLADAEGPEGTFLSFGVAHSTWPVRGGESLTLSFRTANGTATSADYAAATGSVTVPAIGAAKTAATAEIRVAAFTDDLVEDEEEFTVRVAVPRGRAVLALRLTAEGTIRDTPPPLPDPDPPPQPDPDPPPEPPACESRVAPYWRGTGGFAARPSDGRSAVLRLRCGGASYSSREYAGDDGLIVRAVRPSTCIAQDGQPLWGELAIEGIEDGGWYWINGDRNVALAPLVCESSLNPGLRPPVPAGITAYPRGDRRFVLTVAGRLHGTLMTHDRTGFMGIVPHLTDTKGGGRTRRALLEGSRRSRWPAAGRERGHVPSDVRRRPDRELPARSRRERNHRFPVARLLRRRRRPDRGRVASGRPGRRRLVLAEQGQVVHRRRSRSAAAVQARRLFRRRAAAPKECRPGDVDRTHRPGWRGRRTRTMGKPLQPALPVRNRTEDRTSAMIAPQPTGRQRQLDLEGGAGAPVLPHPRLPAVGGGDAADDRESQAGAAATSRVEQVEHPLPVRGGDARPVVADREHDRSRPGFRFEAENGTVAVAHRRHRIVDQVQQQLVHLLSIDLKGNAAAAVADLHGDAGGPELAGHHLGAVAQEFGRSRLLELQLLRTRIAQEVGHEAFQATDFRTRDRDQTLRGARRHLFLEHLHVQVQRVQGTADLVREAGSEGADVGHLFRLLRLPLDQGGPPRKAAVEQVAGHEQRDGQHRDDRGLAQQLTAQGHEPLLQLAARDPDLEGAYRADRYRHDLVGHLVGHRLRDQRRRLQVRRASDVGAGFVPAIAEHQVTLAVEDLDGLDDVALHQHGIDVAARLRFGRHRRVQVATGALHPARDTLGEVLRLRPGLDHDPVQLPLGQRPENQPAEQGEVGENEGAEDRRPGAPAPLTSVPADPVPHARTVQDSRGVR